MTVQFEPTDRTHLVSTGSKNINRYDQFPLGPGDGTTGAECDDGCGAGGVNIPQMIFDLNAAIVALEAVKLGLDATALVLDVIPDGVIAGGLVVSTGVTIPCSDIAKAVVGTAGIAIETAILEMETDLDGDGIPNFLEPAIGTSTTNRDTDGDGLGDYDEIEEAGGYCSGSRRPNPNVADSDGLSDGDEAGLYNTSFCVADTDHDGLTDLEELRGQANPPSFFPFNPTNPLDHDTDNDWIYDGPEVRWLCSELLFVNLDNDGDGYVDEDDVDFYVRYVPVLDPTNRDSDSDGFIDGLDEDPCNTQLIPIVRPVVKTPVDTDGDGFADDDEIATSTDPRDGSVSRIVSVGQHGSLPRKTRKRKEGRPPCGTKLAKRS